MSSQPRYSSTRIENFNDVVQMDVIFRDASKNEKALHIIDVASRLSVVCELTSRRAEDSLESFILNWVAYFGWPKKIVADADGSWMNNLWRQKLEDHGVNFDPAPAEAHSTVGLIDRHTDIIKENAERQLVDDPTCPWILALCEASGAKNHGILVRGYCPLELAFGFKP